MKKLLLVLGLTLGLSSIAAHAQAVNNRTFFIDPPPAVALVTPTEWRLYCAATPDASTWNKATALVKTVLLPALTTGVVPLADTILYCAATFAGSAAIESPYSNVVYAKPYGTPVIKITMDFSIMFENFTENGLPAPITTVKVNGVTVR